ncbi:unnamed protein product [Haemonchus placei]|uniref:Reverse transcriptase domain-containing protein n=1 Tax=Haemonchus placei TaxID=6290 RepID=A0A0N4WJG1_HAEPC|nr:unnamed protein product [Haemonchus placei]
MFGEVPEIWKESIITAIPKTPHANVVSSSRPISFTSPVAKVLEKLVPDKLATHFRKNMLIPLEQHGFVEGASASTLMADC